MRWWDVTNLISTDIFTDEQLRHQPVQQGDPADAMAQEAAVGLDASEASQIEERLRDLGYIE